MQNIINLTSDGLDFILEESKNKLKSTVDSIIYLQKKAGFLLLLTMFLFLFNVFNGFNIEGLTDAILYLVHMLSAILGTTLACLSLKGTLHYDTFFKPEDVMAEVNEDESTKYNILQDFLLSWYNDAIKYNIKINNKLGKYTNISLFFLFTSIIFLPV